MKQKVVLNPGEHIQFHAQRIVKGNPVTGKFISQDETWINIELTKDIEGLSNEWFAGEEKFFRQDLIGNIKIIK